MSDSAAGSLPFLLEDESRLDWPDATYRTDVTVSAGVGHATVRHLLSGTRELRRLIDEGSAAWAVELRCPKTLMARTVTSTDDLTTVRWETSDVDGEIFLVPGLVTIEEATLDSSELSPIWQEEAQIHVPRGWWLARGDTVRTDSLMQSLLNFERADLAAGRMEVAPDSSSGVLRFTVRMAPDLFEAVHTDRTLQVAALVGVCGWFPRVFKPTEDGSGDEGWTDEQPVAQELRARIEKTDPDVTLWEDTTNYDPALVATLLEPFHITPADGQDDE